MGKAVMPAAIINPQPIQDVIAVRRDREQRAGEKQLGCERLRRRTQSRNYARAQQAMCYRKWHRLSLTHHGRAARKLSKTTVPGATDSGCHVPAFISKMTDESGTAAVSHGSLKRNIQPVERSVAVSNTTLPVV